MDKTADFSTQIVLFSSPPVRAAGASIHFSDGGGGGGGKSKKNCIFPLFSAQYKTLLERASKLKILYFLGIFNVKCNGFVVPYTVLFKNLFLHCILIFQVVKIIGGGGNEMFATPIFSLAPSPRIDASAILVALHPMAKSRGEDFKPPVLRLQTECFIID